jgi:hypothetical protein
MLKPFQELGTRTASIWASLGGHAEAFPEAATRALTETAVLEAVEVGDVVTWLAESVEIPEQYAKEFGQPPINLFVAENFYIQALFWIDGTTAIHEHAFRGAFGVLCGSSVHSQYKFEVRNVLSPELRLGNVRFSSSELLRRGDVRPICSGGDFIHALFHLDRPSVSIVVRTPFLPHATQYSYVKPHVAFNPFFEDTNLRIKLRLLESLRSARSKSLWDYAKLLIEKGGPWVAFRVLIEAFQASREYAVEWQELLDNLTARYGSETMECFIASIKEDERSKKLARLRSYVGNRDYRLFLALLLNVPDRDTLLNLLSREFKTDRPQSLVAQWIRQMSEGGMFVMKFEPALLDTIELVAQHGSFESARAAVLRDGTDRSYLSDEEQLKKLWAVAQSLPFFEPLFDHTSSAAA